MDEQSLITDEHRALIGKVSEPQTVVITAEEAYRVRDVIGDQHPRYAGDSDTAAPYTLFTKLGARGDGLRILPNGILTTQEWRYSRQLRIGETLTVTRHLSDLRERFGGRFGHTVLVTHSTDYHDSDGNHVATELVTSTMFDAARVREGAAE